MAFFARIDHRTARHFHRGRWKGPSVASVAPEPPEGLVPALRKQVSHAAQRHGIHGCHGGRQIGRKDRKEPAVGPTAAFFAKEMRRKFGLKDVKGC